MLTTMSAPRRRRRQTKIQRIAAERNQTAEELLIELFNKYKNQSDVAEDLGVSQPTVSTELRRLNLRPTLHKQDK